MPEAALQVENLVKVFDGRRLFRRDGKPVCAVDGLSFQVQRGAIFGLLGPNGAGKTTTLKILNTLVRPTGGKAAILGFDVVAQPLEVRRRICAVMQETAVELFLSVRDNLLTFARFHGLDSATARKKAGEAMERFGLVPEAARKVQDLSGGFRRRVQVAKVFVADTPILFLDEFSTGMDPLLKREVMDAFRSEVNRGRTIVLTTQILSEAEELCDDILIMQHGKQVARGDLHALKLLSDGVYEVALTFDKMPQGIEAEIDALQPIRRSIERNTLELALKADEARVLEWLAGLARRSRILHVEMSGASLEDIFVTLTQRGN